MLAYSSSWLIDAPNSEPDIDESGACADKVATGGKAIIFRNEAASLLCLCCPLNLNVFIMFVIGLTITLLLVRGMIVI